MAATFTMKLELIPLPVTDVDHAKKFYAEKVGFHVDHDVEPGNGMRILQMTPPGSACSIVLGTGMGETTAAPVKGLHLVVEDIVAARDALVAKGVAVGEVMDMGGVKFAAFNDPDENGWLLQEIPPRS